MEINVSDMPQDFWAWLDTGELKSLGICDGYEEAFEGAEALPHNYMYVFSREGLMELRAEIERELT